MFIPAAVFEQAPKTASTRSLLAVAYLVVFGSIGGFTAFIYSVARLPVAIASVYTFVNPVVAVFLGWLFFREPFGVRQTIAMAVILSGMMAVKLSESAANRVSKFEPEPVVS